MAVRLLGRIERKLDDVLKRGFGLPLPEYRALCALVIAQEEGGLRMRELSERIGLKESSVTRLMVRLERHGLTERTTAGHDRRGVTATITDAGLKRYADATPTYRATLGAELDQAKENQYLAALASWVREAH